MAEAFFSTSARSGVDLMAAAAATAPFACAFVVSTFFSTVFFTSFTALTGVATAAKHARLRSVRGAAGRESCSRLA